MVIERGLQLKFLRQRPGHADSKAAPNGSARVPESGATRSESTP